MVVFSIGPTALEDWLSGFFPLSCSPERTGEGKGRRRGKGSEREWRRGTEGEGLAPDVKSWRCHCILETIGFNASFYCLYLWKTMLQILSKFATLTPFRWWSGYKDN